MKYCRLNQKLFIKPYILPTIVKNMQQMDGIQYVTVLDIDMGYYTIIILLTSKDMMTIVTDFLKFRYNHLLMGMCTLVYIFQSKYTSYAVMLSALKNIFMIHRS